MSFADSPVLIVNRGEIAIRVARSCKALGFPVHCIYSDADRNSEYLQYSEKAYALGSSAPKESYLNIEKIIKIAKKSGAKLIHPGYGFLSERAQFVEEVTQAGLIFVGPTAASMRTMGNKIEARKTVDRLGLLRVPGSLDRVNSAQEAAGFAKQVGYPILLKAAAGGGGKGMRRVDSENNLPGAFDAAAREALSAFGDEGLYVEKLIINPHHVEVQIFGDGLGSAIQLGERECSVQRRHQKIWEESPSPLLEKFPSSREKMFEAAIKIAESVNYAGAGTIEFIMDEKGNFYFLEMNTRLQVEHPVTEWITGIDLVGWQLLLATGQFKLPASIPVRRGCAIEVRIYAEDPVSFLPAPGAVHEIRLPSGPFVRVDSSMMRSGEVSVFYDPLIAKISVWANDRTECLQRLRVALDETEVRGELNNVDLKLGSLMTNLRFLQKLVRNTKVLAGETSTDLIIREKKFLDQTQTPLNIEAAIAGALVNLTSLTGCPQHKHMVSLWERQARNEGILYP